MGAIIEYHSSKNTRYANKAVEDDPGWGNDMEGGFWVAGRGGSNKHKEFISRGERVRSFFYGA